ncbi:MAG: UDP-N-acetylenolpyruvoylglucosamine reductase [Opitutaceae bacterium]|nr:UDP-N-acetylenolpyruvoylglucosamine reductase [Opitutaceae bacterium]
MIIQDADFSDKHFHLLGVGGMGMAPLAIFLKQVGCKVSGEDDNFHPRVHELLLANEIEISQKPKLETVEGVVYSNAIADAHPIISAAEASGIPTTRRGHFLAELSSFYNTVVVAGSHGKTTTCGLLIHILKEFGFNFSYILGGLFSSDLNLPAGFSGQSKYLIIEVDESDGSIDAFKPSLSLLVNVDWDHSDYYATRNKCLDAFKGLLSRTTSEVFVNQSCENSRNFNLNDLSATIHTFGEDGQTRIEKFENGVLTLGGKTSSQSFAVPFEELFNVQNALAALSVARHLTNSVDKSALENFPGLWRRQEYLYQSDTFSVVEDYGHHPTEIRNLFEALKKDDPFLTVVFQPHRYSRTLQFKREFADVMSQADRILFMEVYAAGEKPIWGGMGIELFEMFTEMDPEKEAYFCKDHSCVMDRLKALNPQKGILLFLGAGDIQSVAAEFAKGLIWQAGSNGDAFVESVSSKLSPESTIRAQEPLASKTTLRVGGSAQFFAEPNSESDLQTLLLEASKASLPIYFLGRGSNLIVPDSGVQGLVIRLSKSSFRKIEKLVDGRVRAGAGVRLKELCGFMRRNEMTGYEFLEGIPGCVGGALRMNAGAMGGWISEVISEVVLMNYLGDVFTLAAEELHFGYRHCREMHESIALAVMFKAGDASSITTIQHNMDTYQSSRKESQPRLPSAGCTFKNPEGSAAGLLIDRCDLKGMTVGGAEVSDVHANFLVNNGFATAAEVISLINKLRKKVYQKTGYKLEPEVILYGDSWENFLDPLPEESHRTHPISQT